MKRVFYLCNYSTEYIQNKRNNQSTFSQAANNKIEGITQALSECGCEVTVLSSGLTNNKTFRFYKEEREPQLEVSSNPQQVSGIPSNCSVLYAAMRDIPFIGNFSSAFHMYRLIRRLHRQQKVDNIIFYNYKPEVAFAAMWAKKRLGIPITVEYEDGYANVDEVTGIKKKIFLYTEKKVSNYIDSAILVSAQMQSSAKVPCAIVRGVVNKAFYQYCQDRDKKENDKFTILYSGDLGQTRGVGILCEALKFLKLDCRVVITGKGEIQCNDPRVDFKGFVSHSEVKELMRQTDVLLQCQRVRDDFAGTSFPSKIFEYIATENQIVSSKMKDVVQFAGDAFLYYEDDDPKKLAQTIEKAYTYFQQKKENDALKQLCEESLPKQVGKRIIQILK